MAKNRKPEIKMAKNCKPPAYNPPPLLDGGLACGGELRVDSFPCGFAIFAGFLYGFVLFCRFNSSVEFAFVYIIASI